MRQAIPPAASHTRSDDDDDFWRGAGEGLVPLSLLVVVAALAAAGTALARVLATPLGFLTWQWIVTGVWVGGLIIVVVVYAVATVHALRQATAWRDAGLRRQAAGAFWALGVAALIVLLPVLVALALPQHPAP